MSGAACALVSASFCAAAWFWAGLGWTRVCAVNFGWKVKCFFSCVDGSMRETIKLTLDRAHRSTFGLGGQMWSSKLPFTFFFVLKRLLCFLWPELADDQLSSIAVPVSADVSPWDDGGC